MTEISHLAPPHPPRAAMIARGSSTCRQVKPPRNARACHETVAMDWRRLRTIVDALLRRAAGSTDRATAIAITDRAVVVTERAPEEQERIDG